MCPFGTSIRYCKIQEVIFQLRKRRRGSIVSWIVMMVGERKVGRPLHQMREL